MELVYYLLPLALSLGALFLLGFLFAVRAGEFDDLDTPAHRILLDDDGGEEK
jgi:cbb3-type cytochrome oxidase maturation protein